ncbi:MAG: ABC transporter ATP-binding protein [Nitrospirae bacterium]|nr:MAG: ABC transporter ATP-binding protein [Nitrospirota bacterium]
MIGDTEIKAVDNVSFEVKKGEFVSIVGHSGSGKTTLMSLLGGLTRPDSGEVIIDGQNIWQMDDDHLSEFRNEKMSFIYQFSSLISTLNVLENVLLPTAFSKNKDPEAVERAVELLNMVGLGDRLKSMPSELSGGQQRRAAIVRAFIKNPLVVLADEPTGDLDEETEREVMELFKKINRERGITFVMVTHNTELARQADRQFRMSNGVLSEVTP